MKRALNDGRTGGQGSDLPDKTVAGDWSRLADPVGNGHMGQLEQSTDERYGQSLLRRRTLTHGCRLIAVFGDIVRPEQHA